MNRIGFFYRSAGVMLLATASAKFISTFGTAGILDQSDPILTVTYRSVFVVTGTIETVIAMFLLSRPGEIALCATFLAWLATTFAAYRIGLVWIGIRYCPCLGTLTGALHVSPGIANVLMICILVYLAVGSYGILTWTLWRSRPSAGLLATRGHQLK